MRALVLAAVVWWHPGDYTNFVVVSETNLAVPLREWPVWLVTDQTNFQFQAFEWKRFFTLYGTNSDGQSAWAGQTNECTK